MKGRFIIRMTKDQADKAKDAILENIVTHRILPGSVVFETTIAEKLLMSRTPVRQALNDIVAMGLLVKVKGKRGYLLPNLSCKDMLDVWNMRKNIEMQAVQEAASIGYSWDDTHIKTLLSLLEEERSLRDTNRFKYSLVNTSIHQNLVQLSNNPYIIRVFLPIFWRASLYDFQFSPFYNEMTTNADSFFGGFDEHFNILKAICEKKPKEAACNIEKHIVPNITRFLSIYKKIGRMQ